MLKSLPLFYLKKSRYVANEIFYGNNDSFTECKKSFQNQVFSYFENSKDESPELSEEPLCPNKKIQIYRNGIPMLHTMALRLEGGNIKEKLNNIFKLFDKLSNSIDPSIREQSVGDLDIKCYSIVNFLQPSEILRLLNLLFKINPNKFTTSYFYDKAVSNLIDFVENQLLTDHEMIQLLWLISQNGLQYRNYMIELDPYIPDIDQLPLMEKCILVQSFYNTSKKLKLYQTEEIMKSLDRDFNQLIYNPDYLIILCKALVISETTVNISLDNLNENILKMKKPINFLTSTYLLNLYALTRICDEKVTEKLLKQSIKRLKEEIADNKCNIPLLHLEKFLWSISFLGIYLELNEKVIIQNYLDERYAEFTEDKENLPYLLNIVVCTIMLSCWNIKFIKKCLEDKVFDPFFKDAAQYKVQPQVQLLLTLLPTEVKILNFLPEKFQKLIDFKYTISENISALADIVVDLAKTNGIRNVEIECPVKAIPIPGVTFSTETETFHIDVLDDVTCFKETTLTHGLANLKFRIISRYGYEIIKIDNNIFKDTSEKIKSYIAKQIESRI